MAHLGAVPSAINVLEVRGNRTNDRWHILSRCMSGIGNENTLADNSEDKMPLSRQECGKRFQDICLLRPPREPQQSSPSSVEMAQYLSLASLEWTANRASLPVSLRMIKQRKKQQSLQEEHHQGNCSCSMKKAFESIVFIIRELHKCVLQMRGDLTGEADLQLLEMMARVHQEVNTSFAWLFQHVFSCTPVLMVSLMLLLADFTVHSSSSAATSVHQPPSLSFAAMHKGKVDHPIPTLNNNFSARQSDISTLKSNMEDVEVKNPFVSHIPVQMAIMYQNAVSEDPENSLLLSNFAQFLYLTLHDNNRAEYYFRRAMQVEPLDAECLSQYADFLSSVKKDNWAADEIYSLAIRVEPHNTAVAAKYAKFLWNVGTEEERCDNILDSSL